jgi:dihydroneopterin aldolase
MSNRLETVLSVDNIRVKAFHGWYESERKLGGMYSISVKVYNQAPNNEDFHDLETSVNYEDIQERVVAIMKEEFKLIEESCKAIFDHLKELKPNATWKVSLVKENPPIKYVGATKFEIKG